MQRVSSTSTPPTSAASAASTASCMALVPCAGVGTRAATPGPKQYARLAGRTLIAHTLHALLAVAQLESVVLLLAPDDAHTLDDMAPDLPPSDRARVQLLRCGGVSRAATVCNGLQALLAQGRAPETWVLVHDAARCLVQADELQRLIAACAQDPVGGLLAWPVADTLKQALAAGDAEPVHRPRSKCTIARSDKWLAQTPQMFRLAALHAALQAQSAQGFAGITDEASAMELQGHAPLLVRGHSHNFKVTYPEDFLLAEAVLLSRRQRKE